MTDGLTIWTIRLMQPDDDVQVTAVGWDWRHPATWRLIRPDGHGEWVFVQCVSAARWYGADGEVGISPGECLLFPPTGRQDYGADKKPFVNHWFHARGAGLGRLVERLGLATARPIPLERTAGVGQALHRLHLEFTRREPHWPIATAAAATAVLVEAARAQRGSGPQRRSTDAALHALRAHLHQQPLEPWPVARMAHLAGLSPSRFNARYRAAFATSPNADLIMARLALARRLLEGGATVEQAAAESGFGDVSYFHRQFRRRLGLTPGTCRPP